MSQDHRHAYYKKHPRDFGNEYQVISVPEEDAGDPEHEGWERIDREAALNAGRWDPGNHTQAHVTVLPCDCGNCALSKYAAKHRWSVLAHRIEMSTWMAV